MENTTGLLYPKYISNPVPRDRFVLLVQGGGKVGAYNKVENKRYTHTHNAKLLRTHKHTLHTPRHTPRARSLLFLFFTSHTPAQEVKRWLRLSSAPMTN